MIFRHYLLSLAGSVLLLSALSGCNGKKPGNTGTETRTASAASTDTLPSGDNSRVSVDWPGTYKGVLPCADCEGIETILTLKENNHYLLIEKYLKKGQKPFEAEGTFQWDPEGGMVTLKESGRKFQVGENQLFHLDMEGRRIEGSLGAHYILKKQ